jgi:hypothetical protein
MMLFPRGHGVFASSAFVGRRVSPSRSHHFTLSSHGKFFLHSFSPSSSSWTETFLPNHRASRHRTGKTRRRSYRRGWTGRRDQRVPPRRRTPRPITGRRWHASGSPPRPNHARHRRKHQPPQRSPLCHQGPRRRSPPLSSGRAFQTRPDWRHILLAPRRSWLHKCSPGSWPLPGRPSFARGTWLLHLVEDTVPWFTCCMLKSGTPTANADQFCYRGWSSLLPMLIRVAISQRQRW